MREFREAMITDKEKIDYILSCGRQTICEFCFGNIFIWGSLSGTQISICNHNNLICRSSDINPAYSMPKGFGNYKNCIEELREHSKQNNYTLKIYSVTDKDKKELEGLFPNKFKFIEARDKFDYVYLAEDLANLSGKHYHSKRNHIAYFEKNYDWQYEDINESNVKDCISMNEKWYEENSLIKKDGIETEYFAVKKALYYFKPLGLKGGLIRANGDIVAFTLGEKLNDDTFVTHIEKAYSEIRGAYPIINREFAKVLSKDYKYINREEDLGIEGLRKAKLSYQPCWLEKEYVAVYEE